MSRVLDNWLETFLNWTLPRSEAPESLLVWSGLFTLASAVKRHVAFPSSLLGSYDVYPNLYVIFVGPAAVVRKSTTAAYSESLLLDIDDINLGPSSGSDSKLIESLVNTPDSALSILSSEFSNLVKTSQEGMYDVLTDLFDNRPEYTYSTRMHGVERAIYPSLNLLGCTTPEWIAQNPGYMIGGGFASRVIFIFEKKARQRKLYYRKTKNYTPLTPEQIEVMGKALVNDLEHINELTGDAELESEELADEIEKWYLSYVDSIEHDSRISGYYGRRHVHLHKVMILLSLSERDDLVITKTHFEAAKGLLEEVERKMPRALASVGRNPFSGILDQVFDYIEIKGTPVHRRELLGKFFHDLTDDELGEVLSALVVLGRVKTVRQGASKDPSDIYYMIDS